MARHTSGKTATTRKPPRQEASASDCVQPVGTQLSPKAQAALRHLVATLARQEALEALAQFEAEEVAAGTPGSLPHANGGLT